MPYKIIGRVTNFKGKSLWEILGNLKKFGINRMIGRNTFERYEKPTYIQIVKVEALPDIYSTFEIKRKVIVSVEKTFCGIKNPKLVQLESTTYKSDYFLIHKYNELKFSQKFEVPIMKIFPSLMEFPPLIKEIIIRQMKVNDKLIKEPMMKIIYNKSVSNLYPVICTEKTPVVQRLSIGLGTPVTPKLYQNLIK